MRVNEAGNVARRAHEVVTIDGLRRNGIATPFGQNHAKRVVARAMDGPAGIMVRPVNFTTALRINRGDAASNWNRVGIAASEKATGLRRGRGFNSSRRGHPALLNTSLGTIVSLEAWDVRMWPD
jgi:hypothetical protein